jgi:hypothetical protein
VPSGCAFINACRSSAGVTSTMSAAAGHASVRASHGREWRMAQLACTCPLMPPFYNTCARVQKGTRPQCRGQRRPSIFGGGEQVFVDKRRACPPYCALLSPYVLHTQVGSPPCAPELATLAANLARLRGLTQKIQPSKRAIV